MTTDRWIGFGVVWLALLVLTVDMLLTDPEELRDPQAGPRRRLSLPRRRRGASRQSSGLVSNRS